MSSNSKEFKYNMLSLELMLIIKMPNMKENMYLRSLEKNILVVFLKGLIFVKNTFLLKNIMIKFLMCLLTRK